MSREVKSEKDQYHMLSIICGILKHDTNELLQADSQTQKVKLTVTRGCWGWVCGGVGAAGIN